MTSLSNWHLANLVQKLKQPKKILSKRRWLISHYLPNVFLFVLSFPKLSQIIAVIPKDLQLDIQSKHLPSISQFASSFSCFLYKYLSIWKVLTLGLQAQSPQQGWVFKVKQYLNLNCSQSLEVIALFILYPFWLWYQRHYNMIHNIQSATLIGTDILPK